MNMSTTAGERVSRRSLRDAPIIRPATRADVTLIAGLLQQLSDHASYLRYHVRRQMSPDAAQREAERMVSAVGGRLALVAIRRSGDEHEAVAVGELAALDGPAAELAVLVREDLQQRGIGTRLARALLVGAQLRGVRRVRADVLAENLAARRLMQRMGLQKVAAGYGTLQFEASI